jgi:antitoxin (DNA-binding transcriptional repressor) of toxin-antitoxin stability system
MKSHSRVLVLLAAAALAGGTRTAAADDAAALTTEIQTMDARATTKNAGAVTGKIAGDFESFAGSKRNSTALVTGLRSGAEVTLTQKGQPPARFTPATKPMGYGNVSTSLALARYQLGQQGIANPTPQQLKTALDGGTITSGGKTVEYRGILQMRADGLGWGQIAQQVGTKLGPVVSGLKSQNTHIAALPAPKPVPVAATTSAATRAGASAAATAASDARGASGGKGIVTASGAPGAPAAAKGKGADGVTTAGSGAPAPRGQGIVTAANQGASPVAQGAGGNGRASIVAASGASGGASTGGGPGNGKAVGHAK